MTELADILAMRSATYYWIGVFVVSLVVFVTAARNPNPRCRRCKELNRPMAMYCAQCGHKLRG